MSLSNTEFLDKLQSLFTSSTTSHSIYLTTKRAPPHALPSDTMSLSLPSTSLSHPLLVRATDGASPRTKFSTLVQPPDLATFNAAYLPLLRTSLSQVLKKRDKAKERRAEKLRETARKRFVQSREAGEGVRVVTNTVGSKRGAGRRKRQRALRKGVKLRSELREERARKTRGAGTGP